MAIKRAALTKVRRRAPQRAAASSLLRVVVSGELPARHVFIRRVVIDILAAAGIKRADLSFVLLSDKAMRRLNCVALGHDHVTDVVTFDLADPKQKTCSGIEGEIYICPGEARRNARKFGQPFVKELLRYAVHGMLHLAGQDDATDKARQQMARHEDMWLRPVHGDHLH
jgi:rRNA maturation RNase YbeY